MELRFFYSDDTNYSDPDTFNRVTGGSTALTTVYDVDDASSPVHHVFSKPLPSTIALSAGTSQSTEGDASWVHDDANRHGVRPNNTTFGWENLPDGTYTVEFYPLASGGDRTLEATLGGETKSLYCVGNFSEVIRFTGVTPTAGVIEVDLATASGSDGYAYLCSSRIYSEGTSPAIALDQTELAPGDTLAGTATNFEAEPTSVTLSDGVSPDYTPTPTFTADGDGWLFSADIEDFAAQAKAAFEAANPNWPDEPATTEAPVQGLFPGTITVTVE